MDKKTYIDRFRNVLDLKLKQKKKDLTKELTLLLNSEISLAVKEMLGLSENRNQKFYNLEKTFIETGNFIQHKILHTMTSFKSIYWDNTNEKVSFDKGLFEMEISLEKILSDPLEKTFYNKFSSNDWENFFKSFKTESEFEDFMDFSESMFLDVPPYKFELFLNLDNLKFESKPIPGKTVYLHSKIYIGHQTKGIKKNGDSTIVNSGILPLMLLIYSEQLSPDHFISHIVNNLTNLFSNTIEREEEDCEMIEKFIYSEKEKFDCELSDPSLLLASIVFTGYKPPFLMTKNDLEDLKYLFKIYDSELIGKLIVVFSQIAKNTVFDLDF